MAPWKKICCAVDFSEPSRVALHDAAELARRLGAALTLVHVFEPPPPAGTDLVPADRGAAALAASETEAMLDAWRGEAERRLGAPVDGHVLVGAVAEEILRFAREHETDLLVLATHGRRGLTRLLLGSVAEQVVRRARCAVLVAGRARLAEDLADEAAPYRDASGAPSPEGRP